MSVFTAFRDAWADRHVVLPLFLAVRALSAAVIVPLIAFLVPVALSLSGQPALTDQDIAFFFLTPVGFVVLLALAAIVLIGSIAGVAAMTINIHQTGAGSMASLAQTLGLIGSRLLSLVSYAAQLTIRVLIIVAPFAALCLVIADRLIGQFDINYYLSNQPPEFFLAIGLIGALVLIMLVILLNRLLLWAASLHLVLLEGVAPHRSFSRSAERMKGQRLRLAKAVLLWLFLRLGALFTAGAIFAFAMTCAAEVLADRLRLMLTVALAIAGVWGLSNFLIAGIALGALARILDTFQSDGSKPKEIWTSEGKVGISLSAGAIGLAALIGFSVIVGTLVLDRIETQVTVHVIAHRGAAGIRPENTMASVQRAVDDQADWVEIDVQETADGQVVVMHDSDFMKLAGVDLKIWDATMDDLAQIDIGSWFDPSYSDQRTPLLSDVLEITRDKSKLLIELKYYGHDVDLEARTIAIVEAAGMADQVATMSLKYPAVQKMKTLRPDWTAGVLAATAIGDLTRLDADFIAVSTASVGPRLIRAAQNAGKELFVWTVNDPIEMSAMISLGVDGLITDEPALAHKVMAFRAGLTTSERVFLFLAERFGLDVTPGAFAAKSPETTGQ